MASLMETYVNNGIMKRRWVDSHATYLRYDDLDHGRFRWRVIYHAD